MLYNDDQGSGQDDQHGAEVKGRRIEGRKREPGRGGYRIPFHKPGKSGNDIAANDADQDGNDGKKTAEGNGGEYRDPQGDKGDENGGGIRLICSEARHIRSSGHELQSDDRHDSPHGSRGEQHINPCSPQNTAPTRMKPPRAAS